MSRSDGPGAPKTPAAARGRPFVEGNSGRKPGSKNQNTLITAALLDGESEALLRKGIEVALSGDPGMLKFFLDRIMPRERLINIDLSKMDFADDAVEALERITHAVSERLITPREAADLATLVDSSTKAIKMADVVKRCDDLEALIKGANSQIIGRAE
jgi:hypothetical protein